MLYEVDLSANTLIAWDSVRSVGHGYIGMDYGTSIYNQCIYAQAEPDYSFTRWSNAQGDELSTQGYYCPTTADGTVFIAHFEHNPGAPCSGDIDGDGVISVADALKILRAAMGIIQFTSEQAAAADFSGDGIISIADAVYVLRVALGLQWW